MVLSSNKGEIKMDHLISVRIKQEGKKWCIDTGAYTTGESQVKEEVVALAGKRIRATIEKLQENLLEISKEHGYEIDYLTKCELCAKKNILCNHFGQNPHLGQEKTNG